MDLVDWIKSIVWILAILYIGYEVFWRRLGIGRRPSLDGRDLMSKRTFEEAFSAFTKAMKDKFYEKEEIHGDCSVLKQGITFLSRDQLWKKYLEEEAEFLSGGDPKEAVDSANTSFLLWWHSEETGEISGP